MRIDMICEQANPLGVLDDIPGGGQNSHVAELSAALARCGHDVTVYTRRADPGKPESVVTPQGYTVVYVPAGPAIPLPRAELLRYMSEFAEYLDRRWSVARPDVVHAHFWMSGIAAHLAARAHRIPTVQTFRGVGELARRQQGDQENTANVRLKLEKTVARHASWVVAPCAEEVLELGRLGRPRSRISVVPPGVDLQTFSTEGPIAPRSERPRIVSVGKALLYKGFDTMIEALPSIPDAEFVIVGGPDATWIAEDPEVRRLRALANELGVVDRVVFTGAVPRGRMPAMLRSADVVTCTARYESFGIVALEAMACGVPVVASGVGGMRDTIVADVTGRLIVPGRPRECAEAVTGILRDSFLRRSLGLAGRDRACARYSWGRVANDMVGVYGKVVTAEDQLSAVTGCARRSAIEPSVL